MGLRERIERLEDKTGPAWGGVCVTLVGDDGSRWCNRFGEAYSGSRCPNCEAEVRVFMRAFGRGWESESGGIGPPPTPRSLGPSPDPMGTQLP